MDKGKRSYDDFNNRSGKGPGNGLPEKGGRDLQLGAPYRAQYKASAIQYDAKLDGLRFYQ